jgi:hypothetical protein
MASQESLAAAPEPPAPAGVERLAKALGRLRSFLIEWDARKKTPDPNNPDDWSYQEFRDEVLAIDSALAAYKGGPG